MAVLGGLVRGDGRGRMPTTSLVRDIDHSDDLADDNPAGRDRDRSGALLPRPRRVVRRRPEDRARRTSLAARSAPVRWGFLSVPTKSADRSVRFGPCADRRRSPSANHGVEKFALRFDRSRIPPQRAPPRVTTRRTMSQPPEYRHFAHRKPRRHARDEPTDRIPSLRSSQAHDRGRQRQARTASLSAMVRGSPAMPPAIWFMT